jgi:hypothetical protein
MDIKLGILGSETTFHYVNILTEDHKAKTEHVSIAGTVKMQEAASGFNMYSIIWLCLQIILLSSGARRIPEKAITTPDIMK